MFSNINFPENAQLYTEHTREWIFEAIRNWHHEAASRVFVLIGVGGVGAQLR